jgi:hypothetical protein
MDMTMRFTLPTRDNTDADYFELMMLYHAPATPSGGLCTSSGPTMCSYVTPESGISVTYHVGTNELWIGFSGVLQRRVPLPAVSLGRPHEARASYSTGNLTVYLDSVQVLSMKTPRIQPGQIGFDVYRMDMIVNTLTLIGTPTQRLSISLTGNFDYLL